MSKSIAAVSRIAFLASDVLVDSQPAYPATSQFSRHFRSLAETAGRRPLTFEVPVSGDPASTILRNGSTTSLVSFTASATSHTAVRLVLQATDLSSLPLVLHIAVTDDLSDVILLRSAVPFFLVSYTAQQAHDNALLAFRLARVEKKAVVHVFYEHNDDVSDVTTEGDIWRLLHSEKLAPGASFSPENGTNGHVEQAGVTNGNVHLTNGINGSHSPGSTESPTDAGIPNGVANGFGDIANAPPPVAASLYELYDAALLSTVSCTRRTCRPLSFRGADDPHTVAFVLGSLPHGLELDGVAFVSISLLTPLQPSKVLHVIPPSTSRVILLEQLRRSNTKWTSLFLDIVNILQERQTSQRILVQNIWFTDTEQINATSLFKLLNATSNLRSTSPLQLGSDAPSGPLVTVPHVPKHEVSYTKILSYIFGDHLEVSNSPSFVPTQGPIATSPEFALGRSENTPALDVLKETKLAVDSGYWPLYRWDPVKEARGQEPFTLDSDSVKNDLQQFLDRQNHLSQLVRSKPQLATELVSSLGESVKEARRKKAAEAYGDLLVALDAPPLVILYASDGGTAEKYAKKLMNRAKARGLSASIGTMDSMSVETLANEEYVAFVTSTAGQGEPPQNGRTLFKAFNAAAGRGDRPFSKLRYAVFGLGDSHYWPRPEDAHFYNRPGKDLDSRLEQLGGERFAPLGLGDDQDADGPETGYKVWEPLIWKALGVDSIQVLEAEPDPITNEHIKVASGYLRGTIAEGLQDTSTGALAPSDTQLTKFHGIYQQDDRDIRDERQAQGAEPAYSFMIRVRMPGGVCTPKQWLQMDRISDEHGNGTFKITTRSTFQFHGVIKRHLKPTIQGINKVLLDTLAACGDVNRNVICSAIPSKSKLHTRVYEFSKLVSNHLLPRTTAYHEIWLDNKLVAGEAVKDFEPLYGEFYLPRKFKVAVAVPPTNDVDIFANDLGFIAIVDKNGELAGFNVAVGGGMGVTHGNKKTYPRLADVIGFCTVEQGPLVAEKVMLTQRDFGNRVDRKNARLKYTIDRMGLDVFKAEVESRLGYKLSPARPFTFDRNVDDFGWTTGEDGKHHVTLFIENGRVQDEPGQDFKKGLCEIAKIHKGNFRLTANQHLVISDIETGDVPQIKRLLAEYKLDNLNFTGLRLSSSACVAFPTCGLAMAESERYLPLLIDKVEKICEEYGLRNDSIVMRMTGCPNGCARPYLAEVAFVGKAPGSYLMLLGGGYYGQRLNKIYRESVSEPEILAILRPMIKRYALERLEGEHFGDFVIRAGYIAPTMEGKNWYDRMGGEGKFREVAAQ
ncbi:hypothetical protein PISMIDRAFT_24474 [Pisolithus microcarpus 441]|uniref:assimilatory sulfite reductase (NADPH) n=1 Tax=Pisolithus microcarpus 441 TaxID=765257 RepID=A0A0C9Y3A8_9AGAM|nr:hypothetical protein PISMIDRAFT_24474 [Pisolithus microcarpus 441]